MIAPFICLVASVTDADTLRCADGTRVRVAAINAREKDGSCRAGMACPIMPPAKAKAMVSRFVLNQRLTCAPLGKSWDRVVARCALPNGRDLSCKIAGTGAAAWEPTYARRYRMRCGNER